ncbi:hypothetical protein BC834DRAFT_974754 [Gloeopeniophorella convolvens]|nr:hypothetical protein BC834DRAFT_974754 [Gloeopeniophorella convolvens]
MIGMDDTLDMELDADADADTVVDGITTAARSRPHSRHVSRLSADDAIGEWTGSKDPRTEATEDGYVTPATLLPRAQPQPQPQQLQQQQSGGHERGLSFGCPLSVDAPEFGLGGAFTFTLPPSVLAPPFPLIAPAPAPAVPESEPHIQFASVVPMLQNKTNKVINLYKDTLRAVDGLTTCSYTTEAFTELLGRVQAVVDQPSYLQDHANLDYRVAELDKKIEGVLLQWLKHDI